eukprot:10207861-Lingulodinium_polyedra.AAC.1
MERANVRFTNRPGGGRPIGSHRCVSFVKRCGTMRSHRPLRNAAQQCGRIDRPLPQRLVNRTPA